MESALYTTGPRYNGVAMYSPVGGELGIEIMSVVMYSKVFYFNI